MLAASISASTEAFVGSDSSGQRIVPRNFLNRPRTVVNIMCLTENSISECAGSISQMLAPACGSTVVVSRVPVIVMHLTLRPADGDCRYQSVRCVLGRPGGVAVDQQRPVEPTSTVEHVHAA